MVRLTRYRIETLTAATPVHEFVAHSADDKLVFAVTGPQEKRKRAEVAHLRFADLAYRPVRSALDQYCDCPFDSSDRPDLF